MFPSQWEEEKFLSFLPHKPHMEVKRQMAKKVVGVIKLQLEAGKASPQPPSDPRSVSTVFPSRTSQRVQRAHKNQPGMIIPVVITVYADRTFTFITKTPPASVLIKKACNIESGTGTPGKEKVATITREQIKEIAQIKLPDLNTSSLEAAMSMIEGTAKSMGVAVVD